MHHRKIAAFLVLIFPILAWSATSPLPFFESKELTPYWPTERGVGHIAFTPAQVTPFQVLNQDEEVINHKSLENQISIVSFFFAQCPKACPTMMSAIKRFQKNLGPAKSDVKIYSFSVKPETDSPKRLREYAKAFGIDVKGWNLLTGDRSQIYKIGKEVFKADGSVGAQKSENSFIHTANIYLVDKKLRVRGIYDTNDSNAMALLVQDIPRLKSE